MCWERKGYGSFSLLMKKLMAFIKVLDGFYNCEIFNNSLQAFTFTLTNIIIIIIIIINVK